MKSNPNIYLNPISLAHPLSLTRAQTKTNKKNWVKLPVKHPSPSSLLSLPTGYITPTIFIPATLHPNPQGPQKRLPLTSPSSHSLPNTPSHVGNPNSTLYLFPPKYNWRPGLIIFQMDSWDQLTKAQGWFLATLSHKRSTYKGRRP